MLWEGVEGKQVGDIFLFQWDMLCSIQMFDLPFKFSRSYIQHGPNVYVNSSSRKAAVSSTPNTSHSPLSGYPTIERDTSSNALSNNASRNSPLDCDGLMTEFSELPVGFETSFTLATAISPTEFYFVPVTSTSLFATIDEKCNRWLSDTDSVLTSEEVMLIKTGKK